MKTAVAILVLFGLYFAGAEVPEINEQLDGNDYIIVQRDDGLYEVQDLRNKTVDTYARTTDVTFYYFSRNHRNGVQFSGTQAGQISSRTDYNPSKETLFVIHGWTNSHRSEVNTLITRAALAANDVNVFVVDWSPISRRDYVTAQASVVQVGRFVAAFITQLTQLYGQNLDRVTIAGHSLGAHISGNTGMALNGRVGRLVGLDPAGPLFTYINRNNRIDPTDGRFVQIIHTNDILLGYGITMGHSDYFPNGGSSQPGCPLDVAGICAHMRAYHLYAESITNNAFVSRQCSSYTAFRSNLCRINSRSLMGGANIDTSASGHYYLTTNSRRPFATGSA